MGILQFKFSFIVIELLAGPGPGVVASPAFLSKLVVMGIVIFVTGKAVSRGLAKFFTFLMAIVTLDS